jgi:membrane protein DedA with SNARE-associated domain
VNVHAVEVWLAVLPPIVIYLLVALVIGVENIGIPLPGEVTLVSAALLATTGVTDPWLLALAGTAGAVIGGSVGYLVGRRGGRPMLERLSRRFPRHFGPRHLARAERLFARYGVWAVFFGRFVALLRILAIVLAGALRVSRRRFLLANVAGAVLWAYVTTFAIYYLGRAAEHWLKSFSWIVLVATVLLGAATTVYLKRRALSRAIDEVEEALAVESGADVEAPIS